MKLIKASLVIVVLLVETIRSQGGIIPDNRVVTWNPGTTVGVLGGIPSNLPVFTNMTSLDNSGKTDVSAALQGAINACPWGQVVALPAGTFLLNKTINIASGITLRGAGMANTVLNFAAGHIERQYDNSPGNVYLAQTASGGLTKGSTNIAVADTSGFTVNQGCLIAQMNSTNQYDDPLILGVGGPYTNSASGYTYAVVAYVTAKTSTNVTIWPPLYGDMSARITKIMPMNTMGLRAGLEDFTENVGDVVGIYLVGFNYSWVKGVRVNHPANIGIHMEQCLGMEVRDCYVDGPTNGSPNGAGIMMVQVCGSLVQNNVVLDFFPDIELFGGCSGNVFGYNFCLNANNLLEIDSNHGPHNSFNLYEGNITPRFMCDGYYGSTSSDTLYRNWINGQQTGSSTTGYCISLERFTRDYNIVGNIIGSGSPFVMTSDGTSYGYPNLGNAAFSGYGPPWADWGSWPGATGFQEMDTNVLQTSLIVGNKDYFGSVANNLPLGTNGLVKSYYLTVKPAWFGALQWPPFDPANPNPTMTSIPAGFRYMNGTNPPIGSILSAPLGLRVQN